MYSLARKLMNDHGLGHWSFQLDRAKKRAGRCNHTYKIISLSESFVQYNSEEDVKDIILHEIAHAIAGPKQGHGDIWKNICRQIGAKPVRCYGEHVSMPKGHWHARCGSCKKEWNLHRRPKYITGSWCPKCGKVYGQLTFVRNYG